jgi:hypothetical protein
VNTFSRPNESVEATATRLGFDEASVRAGACDWLRVPGSRGCAYIALGHSTRMKRFVRGRWAASAP